MPSSQFTYVVLDFPMLVIDLDMIILWDLFGVWHVCDLPTTLNMIFRVTNSNVLAQH